MENLTCCQCGIAFGVPGPWAEARRNDHVGFYCPNGHSNYFPGETKEERLTRDLQRAKQEHARLLDAATDERRMREAAERSASAARGQVTRLKNRAANGVCPCCNRTFENLQRHMATKHADFRAEVARG